MKTTIHHIRSRNFNGGITTVATYNPEEKVTLLQYAICSTKDGYNKKRGVEIAKNTVALRLPGEIVSINHTLSMLAELLDTHSTAQALRSVIYSMFGTKTTKSFIDSFLGASRETVLTSFIDVSNARGNKVTRKDIDILFALKP